MDKWRLLETGAQSGAFNMTLDTVLLQHAANGQSPPTLRFFSWQPACLSLGYMQKADDDLLTRCRLLGLDVVKRPTGGLAVLHEKDLCYSVVAPLGIGPLPVRLQEANRKINSALQAGLRSLSIPAEVSVNIGSAGNVLACCEAASLYEVTVRGQKIIGSAQLQKNGWLLQHGSLTLDFKPERLAAVLLLSDRQINGIVKKAAGLYQITGRRIQSDVLAAALCTGFSRELGIVAEPAELTATEKRSVTMQPVDYPIDSERGKPACMT
jgi:lipoate-protein ligase A